MDLAPCIARVESGTPPAHEKGRSGQVNRAARALHTSWQHIKKIAQSLLKLQEKMIADTQTKTEKKLYALEEQKRNIQR